MAMDRATVLVVGDESRASLLFNAGYRTVTASGVREAISQARAKSICCVVVCQVGSDGERLSAVRDLRASTETSTLAIMMTSERCDLELFERAIAAGADGVVTMPLRRDDIERMRAVISLRSLPAALREEYLVLKRHHDEARRHELKRDRLASYLLHDLKNPLNAIDLHAQLLDRTETLSAEGRASIDSIRANGRQLQSMVVNLLDVAKADEGKLVARRSDLDLEPLVVEVLGELRLTAAAQGVRLEASLHTLRVHADRLLLRRVLSNLLENGIRHAPPGTAVLARARRKSAGVEISVLDSGPGVPPSMRESIFDAFVQTDDRTRAVAGPGLGLTFCRAAMEAHEGSIQVEASDQGATFCAWFPDGCA